MIGIIIVAGGVGKRMGAEIPKQFIEVKGKSIFQHCLSNWFTHLQEATYVIVMHSDYHELAWNQIKELEFTLDLQPFNIIMVSGGQERYHSVQNGLFALQHLKEPIEFVGISDAVRPNISKDIIQNGIHQLNTVNACIPAIPVVDSLRELLPSGKSKAVERSNYKAVQTPQWFRFNQILTAYQGEYQPQFTDCASVYEQHFHEAVTLYEGDVRNVKITTPEDLKAIQGE